MKKIQSKPDSRMKKKTKTKPKTIKPVVRNEVKETTQSLTWVPVERSNVQSTNNSKQLSMKNDSLKRKVRKSNNETNKLLVEADSVLRAIDTINSNYRESKSVIKVKLNSNSHEYSDAQILEKAQINHFAERISRSLEELRQIETEIDKTTKYSREIAEEAEKSWYIRWFRYIY